MLCSHVLARTLLTHSENDDCTLEDLDGKIEVAPGIYAITMARRPMKRLVYECAGPRRQRREHRNLCLLPLKLITCMRFFFIISNADAVLE